MRSCVEERLWHSVGNRISLGQKTPLESLLVWSGGTRNLLSLVRLRTGPLVASTRSMHSALLQLQAVSGHGHLTGRETPPRYVSPFS